MFLLRSLREKLFLSYLFVLLVAVGIMAVGYGIGYGTAAINPFTVMIAQDVAGLEPASGLWYLLRDQSPLISAMMVLPVSTLGYLALARILGLSELGRWLGGRRRRR